MVFCRGVGVEPLRYRYKQLRSESRTEGIRQRELASPFATRRHDEVVIMSKPSTTRRDFLRSTTAAGGAHGLGGGLIGFEHLAADEAGSTKRRSWSVRYDDEIEPLVQVRFAKLEFVNLLRTKVTDAGVGDLKSALPSCYIAK